MGCFHRKEVSPGRIGLQESEALIAIEEFEYGALGANQLSPVPQSEGHTAVVEIKLRGDEPHKAITCSSRTSNIILCWPEQPAVDGDEWL